jgi:hypothetical protein
MNATEPEVSTQAVAAFAEVIEEIRDLVPAEESSAATPSGEAETDLDSDRFASALQKIAAATIAELERLIGELQAARAYLQSEGERIERETVGYVALSQTALESVKIISETVGEWRKAGHPVRKSNGK